MENCCFKDYSFDSLAFNLYTLSYLSIGGCVERGKLISAMFLVGGTCIGGGMLALPLATGVSGFFPSLLMMLICWFGMTATALLLLEVSLWMEEGAHMITMTSRILGRGGRVISWLLYLFICYASVVAYTAAGSSLMIRGIELLTGVVVGKELAALVFIVIFGAIIDLGTNIVGRVNTILFIGMISAYFALVGMGISEVKPSLLTHQNWSTSFLAIPLLLTSFSFQTMVPSLTPYLKRNAKYLRLAIIGGTSIALIVYIVWQWLMLGIVPVHGEDGLAKALIIGEPATQFLRQHVSSNLMASVAEFFAFFAIVTSFLGIALGLYDFLADGLKVKKEGVGKLLLGALITIPTFIFAVYFERIFLIALDTSGGFGDSILNGIIPVLMVWIGRYSMGYKSDFRVWGGKPFLIFILLLFVFSLGLEIMVQTGWICSIADCSAVFVTTTK